MGSLPIRSVGLKIHFELPGRTTLLFIRRINKKLFNTQITLKIEAPSVFFDFLAFNILANCFV